MKLLQAIHDPVFHSKKYNRIDKFFLAFIRDERDLPFIYVVIKVSITLLPLAVLLYMPFIEGWLWWTIAVVFQFFNAKQRAPFGLMMHSICHRRLFKKKYKNFIYYITWFIAPFIGHTPETYFSHHIGMHHAEDNMPDDDSSTMYYKRDNLADFIKYVADFVFTGLAGLLNYLRIKNRKKLARNAFTGEMIFFALCIGLCFVNWQATVAVFIFTFFISRVLMMMGNWIQHAFIDPDHPDNPFKSCITCLNIKYNQIAWNDGYHVSHHIKPTLHWTEHPASFLSDINRYAENRSVVFDGLSFPGVFINLMRKRYDVLAKYIVNINDTYKSDAEIITMLRERTKPFSALQFARTKILRPDFVHN